MGLMTRTSVLQSACVLAVCCILSIRIATAADLTVYSDSLAANWADWSWSTTHNFTATSPVHSGNRSVSATFTAGWGALYLHKDQAIDLSGYDQLRFWIHGGSTGNQKLRVVANGDTTTTATITPIANTWSQIDIALSALGSPSTLSDLYWQDTSGAAQPVFYLDDISLIAGSLIPPANDGPALSIDVSSGRHSISDDIYGMNFADETLATELRLPVRRRGGNSTSRYNWQNDTSNTGSDWYFENISESSTNPAALPNGSSADLFVEQDRRTSTKSILTIPLIGWVAKQRKESHPYDCGFKVSVYGTQDSVDPWDTNCGDGLKNGVSIAGNNATDTSIATTTGFVSNWISHLTGRYGTASNGGVAYYSLDNEPMLWSSSHRDIHPQPTSYDELRDRTYLYAPSIKAADPSAQTLGPVLWGWCAYFYSAKDDCSTGTDYQTHGNTPFVPWYLQQMKSYQQVNGVRILDFLDLHYYPQESGVSLSSAGDAATQALRLRSTRSLWDATYTDESWIGDKVRLIPRMRDWVNSSYPGTKLAITEYNWGGLESINGALAQADVLGIFGREGLDLATLWSPPDVTQPGAHAFRIFRNYDGTGHGFGETSIQAASANQATLAIYAAQRSSDSALTLVIINKTSGSLTSNLSLTGFTLPASTAVYRYSSANLNGIEHLANQPLTASGFSSSFPANSITLLEILPGAYPLNVLTTGNGNGTVTSVPAGISCQIGSTAGCNANFPSGSATSLLATASTGSVFNGWSGDCSGKADCSTTMKTAHNVSAAFKLAPNVRIGTTSYLTLQDAYDAAKPGDVIKLVEGEQSGALKANRSIDITIKGGYDAAYSPTASQTTLLGTVKLQQGSIRTEQLSIR
jgi:hypothetical protein